MVNMASIRLINFLSLFGIGIAFQLFPSPDSMPPDIPSACRSALSTDIGCDGLASPAFVGAGRPLYDAALSIVCSSACSSALSSFTSKANSACGNAKYNFYSLYKNNASLTANDIVSPWNWAHNVTCLPADTSCQLSNTVSNNYTTISNYTLVPAECAKNGTNFCYSQISSGNLTACSDCVLRYEAAMLGSSYGRGRFDEVAFSSQLSACSKNPMDYPYSSVPTTTR
jgi:hypothetical protein